MRASSGTSCFSVLPFPETPTRTAQAPAPAEDQPQNFAEALQQQDSPATSGATTPVAPAGAGKTKAPDGMTAAAPTAKAMVPTERATPERPVTGSNRKIAPASPTRPASPASKSTLTTTPTATAQNGAAAMGAGSDLATMMVQSMLLAAHLRSVPAAKAETAVTGPEAAATALTRGATAPDVASLIAQAAAPAASPTTAPTTTAKVALTAAATAMAANILAKSGSVARREIPAATVARAANGVAAKEKKSGGDSAEGSFLQANAAAVKGGMSLAHLVGGAGIGGGDSVGSQPVATPFGGSKSAPEAAAAGGISTVGTAHVEKKTSMSTDLNIPEAMTGPSGTTMTRTPAEVNILLGTNHDFEDALKQVVHIAQLNDVVGSRTPTRIAIELQTPPGAMVNVYVSKQNDTYRAQLSTSDPSALSWVQEKITTLRQSNESGVEVKWLPAQMESNPAAPTTTAGNGSSPDWNREGQNQNYQPPDERAQSGRRDQALYEEDPADGEGETFTINLAALGGAA